MLCNRHTTTIHSPPIHNTQEGCEAVDEVVASYADVGIKDRSLVWNTDLMETLELENLLINGTCKGVVTC